MKRAIRALNANDLPEAQKRLEEADKLSPGNARVKFLLAYLLFAKGDLDQAQNTLLQATALNPHSVRAQSLLGRVYLVRRAISQGDRRVGAGRRCRAPITGSRTSLLADAYLGSARIREGA